MGTESCEYRHFGRHHSPGEALVALARRQHGVVARAQLFELGLTKYAVRRWVEAKRLLPLYPGVYAVGHDALTYDSRRLAAVLACGPGALLSYRAAGAVHRLLPPSQSLEVTASRGCKPKPGIVVHRSRLIHPDDRDMVRAIPVTSVARTFVDLADVLSEERLARAIHEAEVRREFDLRKVEAVLARLPGRTGRHRLERVLSAYRPEPHLLRSEAERKFKRLCEAHRLPRPQFNVNLHGCEVDAYWEDVGVVVEIDGAEAHHTRRAFHEDRARDRRLAAHGLRVARVTAPDLDAGARLAAELRSIRAAAARSAATPRSARGSRAAV